MKHAGLAFVLAAFAGSAARADAPVSLAGRGALERGAQTQDALRNGSAASFGAPSFDDRRGFKLRWRLPFLAVSGATAGPAPFVSGFTPTAALLPGMSFVGEPMQGASAFIPQLAVGAARKLGHLQAGVLSTSLGHGSLVDRYTNSPEGAVRRAGLHLEANLAGIGAALMVGDVLRPQGFVAGRIYGRPIMWFTAPEATFEPNELDVDLRTEVVGIWVTGLSFALDADAPVIEEIRYRDAVWAIGWDNEAALLDNQLVKLIGYLDLNALGGGLFRVGAGAHPGVLAVFDVLGTRIDLTGELNVGTDGYVPRYFDRLYELERVRAFGSTRAKAGVDMPASAGYSLRAQAGLIQALTVFAEARDQLPFDGTRGAGAATVACGASGWLLFFGGNVTASKSGITDYGDPDLLGPGFVVAAEGRVALALNTIHVVGRWWRAHEPVVGDDGARSDGYEVVDGAVLGVEVNLDVL